MKTYSFKYLLPAFFLGIIAGWIWYINPIALGTLITVGSLTLAICSYQGTFSVDETGTRKRIAGFLLGLSIILFSLGLYFINLSHPNISMVSKFGEVFLKDGIPFKVQVKISNCKKIGGNFYGHVEELSVPGRKILPEENALINFPDNRDCNYPFSSIATVEKANPQNFLESFLWRVADINARVNILSSL